MSHETVIDQRARINHEDHHTIIKGHHIVIYDNYHGLS